MCYLGLHNWKPEKFFQLHLPQAGSPFGIIYAFAGYVCPKCPKRKLEPHPALEQLKTIVSTEKVEREALEWLNEEVKR